MLRAFWHSSKKLNVQFNKKNLILFFSHVVHELTQANPAFKWEKRYANLFKTSQSLALKIYHKQISAFKNIPKDVEQEYYIQLKSLKDKFL